MQKLMDWFRSLKLFGMSRAFELQQSNTAFLELSFEERLDLLLQAESDDRNQRRMERALRAAKLRFSNAHIEDIDYTAPRGLDPKKIASLATCNWIERGQHLFIVGKTGSGKTHIACGFAHNAIRHGLTALYLRLSRILEQMEIARADGTLPKLRTQLIKPSVLVLDDWGVTPLSARGREDLLEVIEDRDGNGSIIITSQMPIAQWHDYIGEPTIADAIIDRIIHRAHRLELEGDTMRKYQSVNDSTLEGGER